MAVSSARISAELPEVLSRARLDGALGHVHLDLDALDPRLVGRANSLPVPDGLSVEELTRAIATIRARVTLGAAVLASYAPEFDEGGAVCRAAFAAIDALLSEPP
jgi:arginase family enzyme